MARCAVWHRVQRRNEYGGHSSKLSTADRADGTDFNAEMPVLRSGPCYGGWTEIQRSAEDRRTGILPVSDLFGLPEDGDRRDACPTGCR